jgi:bifunctional diaminopimelate decarboxylase / aspartate kinase
MPAPPQYPPTQPSHDARFVVLKFGGTSVSSVANWRNIKTVLEQRLAAGLIPVVVHSALSGVTDLLEKLLVAASQDAAAPVLSELQSKHAKLAAEMGMGLPQSVTALFEQLTRLSTGIALLGESQARIRARVLAYGELLATRLGEAWLAQQGLNIQWLDAREILRAQTRVGNNQDAEILSATCHHAPDLRVQKRLSQPHTVYITQGFIAANEQGDTVLLGRGGSDTSGSYLAALLAAQQLEIWTDVPGMFSANPRSEPKARLLKQLHYDEAQEIASAGAKVLHPRCIAPLRQAGIPLYVYATQLPAIAGTHISETPFDYDRAQIKAIVVKTGITLISMDSPGMWHQVGWLADVFQVFKQLGLSVDLISTSETNVTVTLDPSANALSDASVKSLLDALQPLAKTQVIGPCAAISLVGRHLRSVMDEWSDALKLFADTQVYLISQAANDLNFTVVVEEADADDLVHQLHDKLIQAGVNDAILGPSWAELFALPLANPRPEWWQQRRGEILSLMQTHTAAYVYDAATVRARARALKNLPAAEIHYAMKANFNPQLLRVLAEEGIGFECVSLGEIEHVLKAVPALSPKDILYTPNFAARDELQQALNLNVQVTLDSVYPLEHWPELFKDNELFIRIDTGQGHGHHAKVKTAGEHTKFGIPLSEMHELKQLIARAGAHVVGLHAHTGSGHFEVRAWQQVADTLLSVAHEFPRVRVLDLGGGLGVPSLPSDAPIDLAALGALLAQLTAQHPQLAFWLEPGRFLVAEAGVLATRVTQIKGKGSRQFLGLSTGMNSLIRPALYDAHHEIINLTRWGQAATIRYDVVGPICESADVLGKARLLPPTQAGDVVLLLTAGAYGRVMSSNYNLRMAAAEIVIEG